MIMKENTAVLQETAQTPEQGGVRFRIVAAISAVTVWLCLFAFLSGVTNTYGETLTITCAINFATNILRLGSQDVYYTLSKAGLAVAYAVMLILLIKNAIRILASLPGALSRKYGLAERTTITGKINACCASSFAMPVCLNMLAQLLANGTPQRLYYGILILAAAYALVTAVLTSLPKQTNEDDKHNHSVGFTVYAVLRQIFFLAVAYFMLTFLVTPAGYRLSLDLRVLFGGFFDGVYGFVELFADSLSQDIVTIVSVFLFMSFLKDLFCGFYASPYTGTIGESVRRGSLRILIVMAIGAALLCLQTMFTPNFEFVFEKSLVAYWWEFLHPRYVPVLLACFLGLVSSAYTR